MSLQGRATRSIGRWAALMALVVLLVGGTSMAMLGEASGSSASAAKAAPIFALIGAAALAAISLFDMFTVPALHDELRTRGPALILVATGFALVGDLLGVVGRMTQFTATSSAIGGAQPQITSALDLLETTFNTAGFLIVSVSFACFGVLFARNKVRYLGGIAIVTGLLTGIGQLRGLEPLFMLANVGFVAWYVGLFLHFRRPVSMPNESGQMAPCVAPTSVQVPDRSAISIPRSS